MKNILLPFVFLISLVNVGFAQDCKACLTKADVLLDKKKATVYIKAERIEKEEVLVRLFNNTPWAIIVPTSNFDQAQSKRLCDGRVVSALSDKSEIDAWYEIEILPPSYSMILGNEKPKKDNSPLPSVLYPDVGGSDTPLLSGNSLLFRIKKEHLDERVRVYLSYNYEWETEVFGGYPSEPSHRVYFFASDYGLNKKR